MNSRLNIVTNFSSPNIICCWHIFVLFVHMILVLPSLSDAAGFCALWLSDHVCKNCIRCSTKYVWASFHSFWVLLVTPTSAGIEILGEAVFLRPQKVSNWNSCLFHHIIGRILVFNHFWLYLYASGMWSRKYDSDRLAEECDLETRFDLLINIVEVGIFIRPRFWTSIIWWILESN